MKLHSSKKAIGGILALVVVAGLFVLTSLLSGRYENEIQQMVRAGGAAGVFVYIFVTIVAVVVAPISTLPLMPIATAIWGWMLAGVFSLIGWTIGAQIAFLLARRFGQTFIQKIFSIEKLKNIEARIPQHHLFWSVVLLRMTIPVDVLSYALGLFSHMKSGPYFLSTLIGVTPFAFVFSFAGTLSTIYQIEIFVFVALALVFLFVMKKLNKK